MDLTAQLGFMEALIPIRWEHNKWLQPRENDVGGNANSRWEDKEWFEVDLSDIIRSKKQQNSKGISQSQSKNHVV